MCGICGIAHADPAREVHRERVERMTEALVHRGPDDDGYFFDGPVGLGMRRLSIIDVAGGRQPIRNEDGSVALVYNGEIYNYRALRGELQAAGHEFSTASDTEVMVHAYEQEGPEALGAPAGHVRRRPVGRAGAGGCCWPSTGSGSSRSTTPPMRARIAFGSEIKCVHAGRHDVALGSIYGGLAQYFTFGYIPPPSTIFAGVRKLAPGTLLTWSPERGAETSPVLGDRRAIASTTARRRSDAGRTALRAGRCGPGAPGRDVPVGALSQRRGRLRRAGRRCISEAAPRAGSHLLDRLCRPTHNELDKARAVAARYSTDHHELVVEPQTVELLPQARRPLRRAVRRLVGASDLPRRRGLLASTSRSSCPVTVATSCSRLHAVPRAEAGRRAPRLCLRPCGSCSSGLRTRFRRRRTRPSTTACAACANASPTRCCRRARVQEQDHVAGSRCRGAVARARTDRDARRQQPVRGHRHLARALQKTNGDHPLARFVHAGFRPPWRATCSSRSTE